MNSKTTLVRFAVCVCVCRNELVEFDSDVGLRVYTGRGRVS